MTGTIRTLSQREKEIEYKNNGIGGAQTAHNGRK